jgi:signal peptidase II
LPAVGLALVVGGAIGNVIDRVREGAVMDFLLFHWKDLAWPAFNLADSFITIGVALLIFDGVFGGKKRA